MIEIRLHELSTNDKPLLLALSRMFANIAAEEFGPLNADTVHRVVEAGEAKIAPEDAPDVGAPTAADVFGRADPQSIHPVDEYGVHFTGHGNVDPATVFGGARAGVAYDGPTGTTLGAFMGNVPAAPLPTASAPVNAAAPAQNMAPAPVQAGSMIELDVHGLPWDARIHASSKARNVDNTWRTRRNVDPALVTTVTAELRTVMGIAPVPVPAHMVPPVPVPAAYVSPVVQAAMGNVPMPPAPPVAPPSAPAIASPPTVSAAPAPTGWTFPQLTSQIIGRMNDGRLTQARVLEVLGQVGVPTLPSLSLRPDLVPAVAAMLEIA